MMTERPGVRQAATIARATFDGFLQSDLMPAGMQAPALIWAAAFLVGPALVLPAQYLWKYPFIRRYYPARVEPSLWNDRLLFLILSAGAIGLVAVVMWDTLLPARRDAYVLAPMPVSHRVQMAGRLGGLGMLFAAFAILLNFSPALLFPFTSAAYINDTPRLAVAHLITATLADAFVFFSVTAVQGAVILTFGRRAAGRLATVAQAGAVVMLLLALLFIDGIRDLTRTAILHATMTDPGLRFSPAAWFTGLYDVLAGTGRPIMRGLAARGLIAGLAPALATAALYAFGYRRLLTRAVETRERSTQSAPMRLGADAIRALVVRRPQEQAICSFVFGTFARSPRHRMLLSVYVGAAIALIATALIPDFVSRGLAVLASPAVSTLSAPLALSAAIAVGVRVILAIPTDVPARWIFQISPVAPARADSATHKAMLLIVLPPVAAMAWGSAALFWGWETAWQHAVYCTSLALALCELLLLTFTGIPFTRPYVPGGSRVHMLWPAYLTGFIVYTYSMAALELVLIGWGGILNASGVFAAAALIFWIARKRGVAAQGEVLFEADRRDEMFGGFNLSEGVAAQAQVNRR